MKELIGINSMFIGSNSATSTTFVGDTRFELVTPCVSSFVRAFLFIEFLKKLSCIWFLYFIYFIVCGSFQKNDTKVTRILNCIHTPRVGFFLLDSSKENKNGISKSVATNAL